MVVGRADLDHGEKQGQRAAPLFWPGSEAEIAGARPTYWKPYDSKMSNEARVNTILSWLDLPQHERPTMLTLYFSDVDSAGHAAGRLGRDKKGRA